MKVIGIGGEPCAGKTTIVQTLRGRLGQPAKFKKGLIHGEQYPERGVMIIGKYDKTFGTFQGTDMLSMAVQPQIVKFISEYQFLPDFENWTLLFEGDRFFNLSFIKSVREMPRVKSLWLLITADDSLAERRAIRGPENKDSFYKSRKTKYANIYKAGGVIFLTNNTMSQLFSNVDEIERQLHI